MAKIKIPGQKSRKKLEKELDGIFSEYVRLRDADDNGWVRCITCGTAYPWKGTGNLHNGHFINRDERAVRYSEINCNSQCKSCNSFRSGRVHIYRQRLAEKHGEDEIKELERVASMGGNYDCFWLAEKIKEYSAKNKKLREEKGLA